MQTNKYTLYPLLSQKDEAKHKENHVDDLKTIKKIVTLSIYMYIYEFQKGALLCEPLCQTVLMASS